MKILAVNSGSSSLKYQLYDWDNKKVISSGLIERIGDNSNFIYSDHGDLKQNVTVKCVNHSDAVKIILEHLLNPSLKIISNINEISGVSHRIVHGGDVFDRSVLITPETMKIINDLSYLAPLHSPANIMGVDAIMKLLPNVPQVAVFDTAFHQTMPQSSYEYAIPEKWRKDKKIRRYGFHGTSHLYVSHRAAVLLGKNINDCNIITLHIGNGASATAIKNGKSFDTSMGFTPLSGLIMGTRCGDIDPAIIPVVEKAYNYTPDEVEKILNKESGVLALSGKYSDRRDIRDNLATDEKCRLALDVECHLMRKYIGAYFVALDCVVDAVVFTAGVGEKGGFLRYPVLRNLEKLGIIIDEEKTKSNSLPSGEIEISKQNSPVKVFVIPTNEEIVAIEDAVAIIKGENLDKYEYSFSK